MRIETVIPGHSTVYFDADCAFCRSGVAVARALDWLRLLRFMPLQSEEARELGLVENRDLSQVVLTRKRTQWGGWRAVKQILFRLPLLYCVVAGLVSVACLDARLQWPALGLALSLALLLSPIGNPAGELLYRWIARNRRCLPGSACSLTNR